MDDNEIRNLPGPEDQQQSLRRNLLGLGLTAALIFFLASSMPAVLMAPTISSLALIASVASAAVAALLRERPMAETLNRWDQAAALLALSLLAGIFTDPAAVQAYLETAGQAAT